MSPTGSNWRIEVGDCHDVLRSMPTGSVHTVVTSPPYFGLRDYGTGEWEGGDPACDHYYKRPVGSLSGLDGGKAARDYATIRREWCPCGARRVDRQIGLEPSPDEFVAALVEVFREVRRVLRDDGTCWLNLGDSYAQGIGMARGQPYQRHAPVKSGLWKGTRSEKRDLGNEGQAKVCPGLKPKDLIGIPWMVAFALRADGWYLRSDIVWSKPNPMPESVTDRPTKSHEYVFLLSKGPRYFYDQTAIAEPLQESSLERGYTYVGKPETSQKMLAAPDDVRAKANWRENSYVPTARNKRSVWTVATQPYAGAHFATFPAKLIEPAILAGAPERACGECGAPWVRVTEVDRGGPSTTSERVAAGQRMADHRLRNPTTPMGKTGGSDTRGMPTADVRTVGFELSCSHNNLDARRVGDSPREGGPSLHGQRAAGEGASSVPGVVLDPFAGAGTTGIVALQHGRDFVGIELNPEYAAMARERIETAVRLGFRAPQNGPVQIPGQASIFDLGGAA